MDIKILVAMHKPYWVPRDDCYFPVHVGRNHVMSELDTRNIPGDDTGENISQKNPYYCELTGLFWAWKNLKCDYVGLCHYRRYFMRRVLGLKWHIYQQHDYEQAMHEFYNGTMN